VTCNFKNSSTCSVIFDKYDRCKQHRKGNYYPLKFNGVSSNYYVLPEMNRIIFIMISTCTPV